MVEACVRGLHIKYYDFITWKDVVFVKRETKNVCSLTFLFLQYNQIDNKIS
jgi:hypothetical protein